MKSRSTKPVTRTRHEAELDEASKLIFTESMNDAELNELRYEIALVDSLIATNIEAAKAQKTFTHGERKELLSSINLLVRAMDIHDTKRQRGAIHRLQRLADSSGDAIGLRQELRDLVDLRRKLVDSETRRRKIIGDFVSIAEFNETLALILSLANRIFDDKPAVKEFIHEVFKAAGKPTDKLDQIDAVISKPAVNVVSIKSKRKAG